MNYDVLFHVPVTTVKRKGEWVNFFSAEQSITCPEELTAKRDQIKSINRRTVYPFANKNSARYDPS
jgi:hypothetical protein